MSERGTAAGNVWTVFTTNMATSFLPVLESGPSSKLNVDEREERVHNKVTEPEDTR